MPGCISQGKVKEAIEGYIAALEENFETLVVAV